MPSAKLSALVSLAGAQVPTDLVYVVDLSAGAAGSKSSTLNDLFSLITSNITDGALRFGGFAAPALSGAGQAAFYFDSTANRLFFSENAGAYVRVGNVTGPAASTDEAIARFDLATGRLLQNSVVTISDAGAFTFPDDVRQTFNPGANVSGFNVGAVAADPGTLINGDLWYDSGNNLLRARINGASVSLGAATPPGGANTQVQFNNGGAFGGVTGFTSDGTNVTAGDGNLRATSPLITTSIDDANGNIIIGLSPVGAAVDRIVISNSTAGGNGPTISTAGSTNINLTISPAGTGVTQFTKNLLMNVGSGSLDNLIYTGSLVAGAVNASFGFLVGGVGSGQATEGPYFLGRGNGFTASANQRGSMFFAAGAGFATPTSTEGSFNFFAGALEDLRLRISRPGSTLPCVLIDQVNTGEIGLSVNNPSGSTVAIATFGVNNVPFVVIDSSANSYFGNGIVNAAPASYTLNATGGSGTNIAGADLVFAGGKGTGNAVQGLAVFKYPLTTASGTTLQALSAASFPPWVSMFIRNDGDVVVANTTTETSILGAAQAGSTKVIEGGIGRVGRFFLVRIWGSVTTTGTPTLRFRIKLNSTLLADTGPLTMANNTAGTGSVYIEAFVNIRTVGATATINTFPFRFDYTPVNGGARNSFNGIANATVDLTIDQTFDVTAEWGTADPNNNMTASISLIDMSR